jgi:hypothetical protein
MGKYLNGHQPTDPIPLGWNEWDVAGNGYPEFNYTLNQNGTQHHYGRDPQDYLVDVLSSKARSFIDSAASSGKPFITAAKSVAYPTSSAYNTRCPATHRIPTSRTSPGTTAA